MFSSDPALLLVHCRDQSSLQGWSAQVLFRLLVVLSRKVTWCQLHTGVVDLAGARVDNLQQLLDLFIRHLLAEVRQDVLELADANVARHVLVEDLEATAVLLRLARVTEATWPVQDAEEGLEVD